MIDFPKSSGKMCDWDIVEAVDGAKEALYSISKDSKIYIATSADASTENDIRLAFELVGLSQYISGYFCKDNLGIAKGSKEFYLKIIDKLGIDASQVVMVGDSIEKDITPAIEAGLSVIWFNTFSKNKENNTSFNQVTNLRELCK